MTVEFKNLSQGKRIQFAMQKSRISAFHRKVMEHTEKVRFRFSSTGAKDMEDTTPEEQLVVLTEEVGKLSRAINKLRIVKDPQIRKQWEDEHAHRLMTIASVTARIASIRS